MTVGIHLINANSQVTLSDDKIYWVFKRKFTVGNRVVAYSSDTHLTFDTGYNGAQPPMLFVNAATGWYGYRILSRDNSLNGNWLISFSKSWTATYPSNFELYMFLPYDQTTPTNPTWGIRINNSNGSKAYDSDMKILNVGGFQTINNPSANPNCNDTQQFAFSHQSTTPVANYGFYKPCFMLPEQGMYIADCLPNNDRMFASLINYNHANLTLYHSWYNYWGSGYNYINYGSNGNQAGGQTIAIIDGAAYD